MSMGKAPSWPRKRQLITPRPLLSICIRVTNCKQYDSFLVPTPQQMSIQTVSYDHAVFKTLDMNPWHA